MERSLGTSFFLFQFAGPLFVLRKVTPNWKTIGNGEEKPAIKDTEGEFVTTQFVTSTRAQV